MDSLLPSMSGNSRHPLASEAADRQQPWLACVHKPPQPAILSFCAFCSAIAYARRMAWKARVDVRLATQVLLLQVAVVVLTLGIAGQRGRAGRRHLLEDNLCQRRGVSSARDRQRAGSAGGGDRFDAACAQVFKSADSAPTLATVGDRIVVVSARPVSRDGRDLGTVLIVRDRTDVESLARQLDAVQLMSTALRAQRHEFANRLHLLGLLHSGHVEEASQYLEELLGSGPLGPRCRVSTASATRSCRRSWRRRPRPPAKPE